MEARVGIERLWGRTTSNYALFHELFKRIVSLLRTSGLIRFVSHFVSHQRFIHNVTAGFGYLDFRSEYFIGFYPAHKGAVLD